MLAVLGLTQCSITCFTWENCSLPITVSKHYNPWQVNDVGHKFQQFIAHRKSKNISKFFWEFLNILYGLFSSTVEFFVQKEDEQVDVDLGIVEQFYYSHSLILKLQQVLKHQQDPDQVHLITISGSWNILRLDSDVSSFNYRLFGARIIKYFEFKSLCSIKILFRRTTVEYKSAIEPCLISLCLQIKNINLS